MTSISICVPTFRPGNLLGLLDNLEATATDKKDFEVVVGIDEGDLAVISAVDGHKSKLSFVCRYVEVPKRESYYSLHFICEAMFTAAAPSSYFLWPLSDEVRLKPGWDVALKRYRGLFPDDLFRLRMSGNKWRNYRTLYECLTHPDNYPAYTRAWLEAVDGIGEIAGQDTWQQSIDYFLGMLKNPYVPYGKGIFRSIPIHDIQLANEEAGHGLTRPQSQERHRRINQIYRDLSGLVAREKFLRLAQRVNVRIWRAGKLREQPELAPLALHEDVKARRISVRDAAGTELYGVSYSIIPFILVMWWRGMKRVVRSPGLIKYAQREWHRRSHA